MAWHTRTTTTIERSKLYSIPDLRARGWSPAAISRFLPEPDEWRENPYCRSAPAMKLWLRARVHRVEKTKRYVEWHSIDRSPKPAREIDLLAAVFAANRTAKRFRDTAQLHYYGRRHGLAGNARETKERLYDLKDRGIAAAWLAGRLQFTGIHGSLAIYRGEGYCFHSSLLPVNVGNLVDGNYDKIIVEAKPKSKREARLLDAEHTLRLLPPPGEGFTRLEVPRFEKPVLNRRSQPWRDKADDDLNYDDVDLHGLTIGRNHAEKQH